MTDLAAERTELPGFGLPVNSMPEDDVIFPTALYGMSRGCGTPEIPLPYHLTDTFEETTDHYSRVQHDEDDEPLD